MVSSLVFQDLVGTIFLIAADVYVDIDSLELMSIFCRWEQNPFVSDDIGLNSIINSNFRA